MKNFKYKGHRVPFSASGADVASGDVVVKGDLVGIACGDVADGESGQMQLTGVFEVAKASAVSFSHGDPVYWDIADAEGNDDDLNNKLMGYAYQDYTSETSMLVISKHGAGDF